jgi:putative Mg2+ transporter-C (MgtC) family protein
MDIIPLKKLSNINLLLPVEGLGVFLRMGLAILVGAIVGWERQIADKPAGLRTHMLVSLGAAIFVLTGIQTGAVRESADVVSRIIQGVVQGIGFLGAGEIIVRSRSNDDRIKVRGLTSAAAIWVSGALGVAAGCGLGAIALSGAIACFLVLWLVKKLENHIHK